MASPKWARLLTDYPCPLRRGAWYRVISAAALEVVVDVNQKQIRVPRQQLHLAEQPTTLWTIVERAKVSPRSPRALGTKYVVCPSCRERVPLEGKPLNMRCPKCNGLFEIDWPVSERKETAAAAPVAASGARAPRTTIPTMPRRRGPDRRTGNRRKENTPVPTERRQADRRRSNERRRGAKRPPTDPAAG
jgi:hypothetical protein